MYKLTKIKRSYKTHPHIGQNRDRFLHCWRDMKSLKNDQTKSKPHYPHHVDNSYMSDCYSLPHRSAGPLTDGTDHIKHMESGGHIIPILNPGKKRANKVISTNFPITS